MKELTQGEVVKLAEGERLDGEFVSCEESMQYKDSYALKVNDGQTTKVTFVNNIVKDLLLENQVKVGQKIAVLYVGLKENKQKTYKYKEYKLFAE